MKLRNNYILIIFFSLFSGISAQESDPIFPELRTPLTQLIPMVGFSQSLDLEEKILQLEQSTGTQMAILIIPSTKPMEIEEYSIKIAEKWKLGRKGIDDGILIVVAKNDRKVRIEVGYGLEGVIPDIIAKEIIDVYLTPNFKIYQFYQGFSEAIDYIEKKILQENLPSPSMQQELELKKRIEANLREMKITRFYEVFIYINIVLAIGFGVYFATKKWNTIGFILPGLYLSLLLLIGQFFVSNYFSEGYLIFFPAMFGYAIIFFIVNFRKIDEKYGSFSSSRSRNGSGSSRNSYSSSGSSKSYSSSSSPRSSYSGSRSSGSFRSSSSSSSSSRSSSQSYSGRGGSFGGGGASGSW